METPPAQRAISESTPIRLQPGTLIAIIGTAIGLTFAAACWATKVSNQLDELSKWASRSDTRMERVEGALGVRAPDRNPDHP